MTRSAPLVVEATPYEYEFSPEHAALLVIDMQRDFVEPGGFGEVLGNDVAPMRAIIEPLRLVLATARSAGMAVIHTREGHQSDLSDCPPSKLARGRLPRGIGDPGPNGRILIRGERGHGIIDELAPIPEEPVIDKPGKGRSTPPTWPSCCIAAASRTSPSPASPPMSACTRPCATPTTAGMSASSSRIASNRISLSFSELRYR